MLASSPLRLTACRHHQRYLCCCCCCCCYPVTAAAAAVALQHIIYEMHVGSFTPEGTLRAAIAKLPHVASLGFTLLELMPCQEHSDPWCAFVVVLCTASL
jgi:hypothetical protein